MRISPALEFESLSSVDFAGNSVKDSKIIEKISFSNNVKTIFYYQIYRLFSEAFERGYNSHNNFHLNFRKFNF